MFKSLKIQLLSFFLIANTLILFGFSLFIYSTAQKGVSDTLDTTMKIISIDVIPDLKGKTHLDAKKISDELSDEFKIKGLYVKLIYFDKTNNKVEFESVSEQDESKLFNIPLKALGNLHSIYYFNKDEYRVSSMLIYEDEEIKIFFQLATKKTVDSPYLKQIVISLLIANPIILILFLLIANTLINKTLSPVKDVVSSVHSISANNLSKRIDSEGIASEIEELVDTFNRLLDNLEDSFKRISSFSSDASHELKTPLTVIRGEIEVTLRQERTAQEYKAVLEELLQETLQVQETIEQLFFITKRDSPKYANNKQELYLDEIITDVVAQNKKFAQTKSIQIKLSNIIPLTIYANETLIKVALGNLLRNAIIYSNEASEVNITMNEDDEFNMLCIEDSGCGIPNDEIPFIFERFYRVDKARSRQNSGTGLGLAIVKMILDIHGYDIDVKSVIEKGTMVIIKIPK